MERNIPKIYSGNNGIMSVPMIIVTMSRKSEKAFCNVSPAMTESPIPMQNDKIRADITSMTGGIPIEKKVLMAPSSIL